MNHYYPLLSIIIHYYPLLSIINHDLWTPPPVIPHITTGALVFSTENLPMNFRSPKVWWLRLQRCPGYPWISLDSWMGATFDYHHPRDGEFVSMGRFPGSWGGLASWEIHHPKFGEWSKTWFGEGMKKKPPINFIGATIQQWGFNGLQQPKFLGFKQQNFQH